LREQAIPAQKLLLDRKLLSGKFSGDGGIDDHERVDMQLAARSSIAAGVAVIGAGVLVAAPVAPPVPDVSDIRVPAVHSTAVELTAFAGALARLTSDVDDTFSTGAVLGRSAAQAAAPAIPRLLLPQTSTIAALISVASAFADEFRTAIVGAPEQLQLAAGQIAAGEITNALNTLVNIVLMPVVGPALEAIFSGSGPLVDLVAALQQPLEILPPVARVVGLLADPDFLLTIGLGPLQSIYALNEAIGGTAEGLIAALQTGNPGAVVGSLVTGVKEIAQTVADRLFNPGTPPYGYDRGLISSLVEAGKMIIAALKAPATAATSLAAITATPAESVTTVTLSTEPVNSEVGPAAEDEAAEPASDTAAEPEAEAAQEETVVADEDESADDETEVRTGLVAVPGEVTVGVADDEAPSDEVAQPVSSPSDDESEPAADTDDSGAGAESSDDAGDSAGSDSGDGSGGSE
jgi:hypothetical protein